MELRIDPHSCLATLLVSLGLAPLAACDRSPDADTTDETEPLPKAHRNRKRKPVKKRATEPKKRNGGKFACNQSFPMKLGGKPTGIELCAGGYHHRSKAVACTSQLPRERGCGATSGYCRKDEDCTANPHGFCRGRSTRSWLVPSRTIPSGFCACDYGCLTDAECRPGTICVCDAPVGRCVESTCKTDDDCDPDMLCAESRSDSGTLRFACQKAGDECIKDADCTPGKHCRLDGAIRRCRERAPIAIPGRPFLVDDVATTASAAARSDWLAEPVAVAQLSPEERTRVAEYWTQAGLMEHASVAAFARFALQLLAQGAPAELVAGAQAAALDEIRHARACFSLASAYAGAPVGPGPLAMANVSIEASAAVVLRAVIREGCIGETVAALAAAEAAACAEGRLAELLAGIADDELRHAELAWRYAAWALSRHPELDAVLTEEIAAALAEPRSCNASPGLPLHGMLDGAHQRAVRRHALEDVIAPCAAALRGRARQAGSQSLRTC
jgi:hypothetical protein